MSRRGRDLGTRRANRNPRLRIGPSDPVLRPTPGLADEIGELADLRDQGVINDQDFQKLKRWLIFHGPPPRDADLQLSAQKVAKRILDDRQAKLEEQEERERYRSQGLGGPRRMELYDDDSVRDFLDREVPRKDSFADLDLPQGLGGPRSPRPIATGPTKRYVEVYHCPSCTKRVGKTASYCSKCGYQLR